MALQVSHGLDGVAALFHHIQHAQRVDGHGLNAAVRLLVEGRGQVCRDGSHVQLALHQQRHDLVGSAVELQVIVHGGGAVFFHTQQVDKAHGGGALQSGNAQGIGGGQFFCFFTGSSFGCCLGDSLAGSSFGCCTAAGSQAQCHGQRQQQGYDFFHVWIPSSFRARPRPFPRRGRIVCGMGRSFSKFYKANLQNHLLCASKFTIIGVKIPLRVQQNCRRAVGACLFPTDL